MFPSDNIIIGAFRFDKQDREAEDSDAEEEDEMNGNNDSEEDG